MRIPAGSLLFALALHSADRVTVTGTVVDQSNNKPIENATVMVYSAGVKKGYDLFCPTCYVDCGKRTTTDASGAFTIAGLSPDLIFNLLVVREGYSAAFVKKVDPTSGAAPSAAIKTRTTPENPSQIVRGLIVDSQGAPVRDALVAQEGIIFEQGRRFGDIDWIDLVAVSNKEGEFEMAYSKPARAMILKVAPRGMAAKLVNLPTGLNRHSISVTDGATIRGRLVHEGKPVANAEFGIATHSHTSGKFIPEIRVGTNENGEFVLTNVPAGRVWDLYAKMDSVASRGFSVPLTHVLTKDDGQDIDVGEIAAQPGFTIRGKITLSDGTPIPPDMRVSLADDHFFDRQIAMLPPDGTFEFKGLTKGVYTLTPSVRGYQPRDTEEPNEILVDGQGKVLNITLYPAKSRQP